MHFSFPDLFLSISFQKYFVLFQTYELNEGKSERFKLNKLDTLIGFFCDVATTRLQQRRKTTKEMK